MTLIITGHANHVGTKVLIIEGRGRADNDLNRAQCKDSQAIYKFLRDHLPCGTLDRLAVRLAGNALDHIDDLIGTDDNVNDIAGAIKDYVAKMDKEST